jgi:hypothetical protein
MLRARPQIPFYKGIESRSNHHGRVTYAFVAPLSSFHRRESQQNRGSYVADIATVEDHGRFVDAKSEKRAFHVQYLTVASLTTQLIQSLRINHGSFQRNAADLTRLARAHPPAHASSIEKIVSWSGG